MTNTQRRLQELEWTLARLIYRPRKTQRVKRSFGVACSNDGGRTFYKAFPIDISTEGIGLISTQEMHRHETTVINLDLEATRIRASIECVSVTKGTLYGKTAWRVGARFVVISPEDRSLIERFVRWLPLGPKHEGNGGPIPDIVIERILNELVRLDRLAPLHPKSRPLVKLTYAGVMQRGKNAHHSLRIESRVVRGSTVVIYTTHAYVDEKLTRVEVVPLDNGRSESIQPTSLRPRPQTIRFRNVDRSF